MKAEFQVIKDGTQVYCTQHDLKDQADFITASQKALTNFFRKHPNFALADEDVVMRWHPLEE